MAQRWAGTGHLNSTRLTPLIMRIPSRTLCAIAGLSAPVVAQDVLPFPLDLAGRDADHGQLIVVPDAELVANLTTRATVTLDGVPLADGDAVRVDLQRVSIEHLKFGFEVDGRPAPDLLDGLDLSIWKGTVRNQPDSEVLLSFSNAGSRGWIRSADEIHHYMPQPDEAGDWSRGHSVVVTSRGLTQLGVDLGMDCGSDKLPANAQQVDEIQQHGQAQPLGTSSSLYECKMAVETDYQLHQVFGNNLSAQTSYVTTLLAASSDRYIEQINTVLTFPYVQFHTNSNDGWDAPDDSQSSSITMLDEFVAAWGLQALPGNANIGHFLSGANLGGGVAYLGVLCDTSNEFTFGVSGNIDGDAPFPVNVGPFNWDFVVFTHETGHSFGSSHTHNYCDPIDECAPSGYWGGCQDETVCINDGTLMSYCHLCPGGISNITTFFHPTVVGVMLDNVEACLPTLAQVAVVDLPQFVAPGVPTALTASVVGTPVGAVEMSYRFDENDAFTTVSMAAQGGGLYGALLPAAECGESPEFFFSATDQDAGFLSTAAYVAEVGIQTVTFADDFESNQGWNVGAAGDTATTGIWERVDPNATAAQPEEGVNPLSSGSFCFVTGQGSPGGSLGTDDVDGGETTLLSPVLDLTNGDNTISYWRWYSNDTSASPNADVFVIDISNDGTNWVNVETVGPAGPETSGGWLYHEFLVSDFVTPTSTVTVRFVASDLGEGSIVEAAIDEFTAFSAECGVCQNDVGFGGPGTLAMSLCGDPLASGGAASLDLTGGPANTSGLIVFGTTFGPVPIAGGTLVPFPFISFTGFTLDSSGNASFPVAGGGPSTLYLQAIAFDGGAGQYVFSNAVEADFLP